MSTTIRTNSVKAIESNSDRSGCKNNAAEEKLSESELDNWIDGVLNNTNSVDEHPKYIEYARLHQVIHTAELLIVGLTLSGMVNFQTLKLVAKMNADDLTACNKVASAISNFSALLQSLIQSHQKAKINFDSDPANRNANPSKIYSDNNYEEWADKGGYMDTEHWKDTDDFKKKQGDIGKIFSDAILDLDPINKKEWKEKYDYFKSRKPAWVTGSNEQFADEMTHNLEATIGRIGYPDKCKDEDLRAALRTLSADYLVNLLKVQTVTHEGFPSGILLENVPVELMHFFAVPPEPYVKSGQVIFYVNSKDIGTLTNTPNGMLKATNWLSLQLKGVLPDNDKSEFGSFAASIGNSPDFYKHINGVQSMSVNTMGTVNSQVSNNGSKLTGSFNDISTQMKEILKHIIEQAEKLFSNR